MAGNLFLGLPPPSATPAVVGQPSSTSINKGSSPAPPPAAAPAPALKSCLKRDKPPGSQTEAAPQKRLRFKTATDATETQVIEAMQKIASQIKNPSKFSKASKLALQLIQAGSVTSATSNHFFDLLQSAMSSFAACADPSLRVDYQSLFSAAQNVTEYFSKEQKNQLSTWTLRTVVANVLYTHDARRWCEMHHSMPGGSSSTHPSTGVDDFDIPVDAPAPDLVPPESCPPPPPSDRLFDVPCDAPIYSGGLDSTLPPIVSEGRGISDLLGDDTSCIRRQLEETESLRRELDLAKQRREEAEALLAQKEREQQDVMAAYEVLRRDLERARSDLADARALVAASDGAVVEHKIEMARCQVRHEMKLQLIGKDLEIRLLQLDVEHQKELVAVERRVARSRSRSRTPSGSRARTASVGQMMAPNPAGSRDTSDSVHHRPPVIAREILRPPGPP